MTSALRPQITAFLLVLGALSGHSLSAATAPTSAQSTCTLTAFDEGKADGNAYRISVVRKPNGAELITQQVQAAQSAAVASPASASYFEGYVAGLEPNRELTSATTVRAR